MSEGTSFIRRQTKLGSFYESYSKLPPAFIDGVICCLVAFLTFWNTFFGGDEAAKFVSYVLLFWLKGVTGSITITLIQLQSFRSRQYAMHMDEKERRAVAKETTAKLEAHPAGVTQTVTEKVVTAITTEESQPKSTGQIPSTGA